MSTTNEYNINTIDNITRNRLRKKKGMARQNKDQEINQWFIS